MAINEQLLDRVRDELANYLTEEHQNNLINAARETGRHSEASFERAFGIMLDGSREDLERTLHDMREQLEPGPRQRVGGANPAMMAFGRDLMDTVESVLEQKFNDNRPGM